MAWWHKKILFPVKRAWLHLSSRVRTRSDGGGGILKLHGDVQTCEYQDVQVMWEILNNGRAISSHDESKHSKRSFWRLSAWPHRQSHAI